MEKLLIVGMLMAAFAFLLGNGPQNGISFAFAGVGKPSGLSNWLYVATELVFEKSAEVIAEIEKIGKDLGGLIEKANEQSKNAGEKAQKIDTELREEIKNAGKKHTEETEKLQAIFKKQQEQLDSLELKAGKLGAPQPQGKSLESELKTIFNENPLFKAYKERQTRSVAIDMKGVDLFQKASTMTISGSLTQTVADIIEPTRVPGVIYAPDRRVHARQILPVGTTDKDGIAYVEETALTNGVAVVAEGATKPQSDFTLTARRAEVKKIATYLRISDELIDDLPGLTSYITTRFSSKLMLEEDAQIMRGSGVGANLTGIITSASSYADVLGISTVNRYDVLAAAIVQIAVSEYAANYILVHPRDYLLMSLTKSTTGEYVFPIPQGGTMSVMGVPVLSSTLVAFDTFLVGDFSLGAMIFDRKTPTIRFYDQDQDNAIKNLITVVIEERLALPIYRPTAFVTGSFNAGLANGSA